MNKLIITVEIGDHSITRTYHLEVVDRLKLNEKVDEMINTLEAITD